MYSLFISLVLLSIFFEVHCMYHDRCSPPSCYKSSSPLQGICPSVYTPFKENGDVNYTMIPEYIRFISDAGINCIIGGSADTGAVVLSLKEKIKLIRALVRSCKKYNITVIPEVGGQSLMDSLEMAKEVSEMGLPAVATLPEIYEKTNMTEMNVERMCEIGRAAKTSKVFYCDSPIRIGVIQNMAKFWKQAMKSCPDQFAGVVTSLERGLDILATNMVSSDQSIFIEQWEYMASAFTNCLNGTVDVSINIYPKVNVQIKKYIQNGFYKKAFDMQLTYNKMLMEIISVLNIDMFDTTAYQYIYSAFRYATSVVSNLDLGFPPKSVVAPLTARQKRMIRVALQKVDTINVKLLH